jgi:putative oxidoreductase
MTDLGSERIRDEALLIARILLAVLFLVFGWGKLTDYSGTVAYMTQVGAPLPSVAALVAMVIEFFGGIALILGVWTRPLAVLFAVFCLVSGLIGHRYWTMTGYEHFMNKINFYKNISLMGGFFLLYVTGAGKYSIDARLGLLGAPPRRTEEHEADREPKAPATTHLGALALRYVKENPPASAGAPNPRAFDMLAELRLGRYGQGLPSGWWGLSSHIIRTIGHAFGIPGVPP